MNAAVLQLPRSDAEPGWRHVGFGLTRFWGRESERAAVFAHFEAGARLVTLVGPAGAGKTRLAVEVLASLGQSLESAAVFCDLSEAHTGEAVSEAVARALSLSAGSSALTRDARAEVGEALASRGRLIVVLDNLEQVLAEGAACVADWLERAPRLRLVATSRERLRLQGEHLVPVGPLPVPGPEELDADAVGRSVAVSLFVDRARAVRPDFTLDGTTAPSVAALVRCLDGLPLALELAATRMTLLPVEQLLDRLRGGLAWLTDRRREALPRHRVLSAAVAWSWDLLSPWEQAALIDLSVFCGGFSIEAAEAVVDLAEWPEVGPVVEVVEALWEKSFVFARGPRRRCQLYGIIRVFVTEQPRAAQRRSQARVRHATYFAEAATTWAEAHELQSDPAALEALETEADNLRALAASLNEEDGGPVAQQAARVCVALTTLYANRGFWPSHLTLLERAHAVARERGLSAVEQARVASERGRALWYCGRLEEAEVVLRHGLEVLGEAEGAACRVRILFRLAQLHRTRGDLDSSDARLDEAAALLEVQPDPVHHAFLRGLRAGGYLVRGRLVEAESALEEAIRALEGIGHRRSQAVLLASLANVQRRTGRADEARISAERALVCARAARDEVTELAALVTLSLFWAERARADEARTLLETAVGLARRLRNSRLEGMALATVAILALEAGQSEDARALLEEAAVCAELGREQRDRAYIAGLEALLEHLAGRLDTARRCAERALAWVEGGDTAQAAALRARLAAVLAALGESRAAAELLANAEPPTEDPELALAVRLDRAWVELVASRVEGAPSELEAKALARARGAVAAAHSRGTPNEQDRPDEASWAQRSFLVRLRLRLLEPLLPPTERARAHLEALDPGGQALLVLGPADAIRPPGGEWTSLEARPTQQRLVWALVEARHQRGDTPLDLDALVEAGWPGERMAYDSATNRLHYTLNQLRKLGLREVLERSEAGYRFALGVAVLSASNTP